MKLSPLRYEQPAAVADAERMLRSAPDAVPLAGGQSLIPALRLGERRPGVLVDLTQVSQLRGITRRPDGDLELGAAEPMWNLERASLVAAHLPLLVRVLRSVGAVGIRSRATLGGSLGWADPTSQLPATLVALGSRVETTTRTLAVEELLVGRHQTALGPGELILRVVVPSSVDQGVFHLVRRTHITWPAVGAVAIRSAGVTRLVVFGAAPTPLLMERTWDHRMLLEEVGDRIVPFDDERATAAYRRRVAPVLARRACDDLPKSA